MASRDVAPPLPGVDCRSEVAKLQATNLSLRDYGSYRKLTKDSHKCAPRYTLKMDEVFAKI